MNKDEYKIQPRNGMGLFAKKVDDTGSKQMSKEKRRTYKSGPKKQTVLRVDNFATVRGNKM